LSNGPSQPHAVRVYLALQLNLPGRYVQGAVVKPKT
jgi:hypothetical protein